MSTRFCITVVIIVDIAMVLIMFSTGDIDISAKYVLPGALLVLSLILLMVNSKVNNSKTIKNVTKMTVCIKKKKFYNRKNKGGADISESLQKLSSEYEIIHKLVRNDIQIEQVIIGPTGIFIIQAKNMTQEISWSNGKLLENDYLTLKHIIDGLKVQAEIITTDFKTFDKRIGVIKPILCFTHAEKFIVTTGVCDDVTILAEESLGRVITGGGKILDSTDVQSASHFLIKNFEHGSCSSIN